MADEEAGEETPLLDEPSEQEAPPPPEEEAPPAPEPEVPAEAEAPPPPTDANKAEEAAGGDSKTKESELEKRKAECKKTKESVEASALQHLLQIFLTCCMPMVQPHTCSRDSSPQPPPNSIKALPEKNASGKLGYFKRADEDVRKAFGVVEEAIKTKVTELKGSAPESLEVVGYKVQQVVGINLFVKVKIDNGSDYIHAKIYEPIEGEPCLIDTTPLKLDSDEVEYF